MNSLHQRLSAAAPTSTQTPTSPPHQRLQQLLTASSLDRPGTHPWHLHMNFTLYDLLGKQQETGTIEEWWVSPQLHKIVIDIPSLKQALPSVQHRAAFLANDLLDQFVHPISPYLLNPDLTLTDTPVTYAGAKLQCLSVFRSIQVQGEPQLIPGPKFCTQPASDALRLDFDEGSKSIVRNQLGTFLNSKLALENNITYSGTLAITGKVDKLEVFDPKTTPIAPEPAAEPVSMPGIVVSGKVVNDEPPPIPPTAAANHLTGTVVLSITITKQGTVKDVEVIASPNPILSGASVNAIGLWTYTPFTANGQPTDVNSIVSVHFLGGAGGGGRSR